MSKSMDRFGGDRPAADAFAPAPSAYTRKCNANGCPNLGTISGTNVGPAPESSWFCRFHFGEPATRWAEITRKLKLGIDPFAKDAPSDAAEYF